MSFDDKLDEKDDLDDIVCCIAVNSVESNWLLSELDIVHYFI